MNQAKDDAQESYQLYALGLFVVVAVSGAWWYKHGYQVVHLWHMYRGRLLILAVFCLLLGASFLLLKAYEKYGEWKDARSITAQKEKAVYLGRDEDGDKVFLHEEYRAGHAQVIGTTNAGKTESVIFPWAIQDIENGSGLLIIDGKSDHSFLEKLYAYAVATNRAKDFRFFSLADSKHSGTFNPLYGGTPLEVTERVFGSFKFENQYYRDTQYKIFLSIVSLIHERKEFPTFKLVLRLLTDMEELSKWLDKCDDDDLVRQLKLFSEEEPGSRNGRISGLDAKLSQFSTGEVSSLFNTGHPMVDLEQVLRENLICYFQLPTMYYGELSAATGKLVLQALQSAVAKRHLGLSKNRKFFCCYLDDFQDYIYEGFGALLNKSRSANVGVVFSHQALGDLEKVSKAFANVVVTNTNIKVVMRSIDPDTCDFLAKTFGTQSSEKTTKRRVKGPLGDRDTGEGSVRDAEEYIFHPNTIKNLERGQGIICIPFPGGVKRRLVRFKRRPDLPPLRLPEVLKPPGFGKDERNKPKAPLTSGKFLEISNEDQKKGDLNEEEIPSSNADTSLPPST